MTPSGRRALERISAGPLRMLTRLPRWALLGVVLGLVVVGLIVRGPVGGAALLAVGLLLGWLTALSWPAVAPPARLVRVLASLVVLVAGAIRVGH